MCVRVLGIRRVALRFVGCVWLTGVLLAVPALAQAPAAAEDLPTATGLVVDEGGAPVPNAQVGALGQWRGAMSLDDVYAATADAAGHFVLTIGAPADRVVGPWAIWARSPDKQLMGGVILDGMDGVADPVTVTVAGGGYIETGILDRELVPVQGVGVEVWLSGVLGGVGTFPTGKDGRARIGPLPAGVGFRLQIDYASAHLAVDYPWRDAPDNVVTLSSGEDRQVAPAVIDPDGRPLRGRVYDDGGVPVEGAKVWPFEPDRPYQPVVTGADGSFELTRLGAVGTVWIGAAHPTKPLYLAAELDPDKTPSVDLFLAPTTTVTGQLVANGVPVRQVEVEAWPCLVRGRSMSIWQRSDDYPKQETPCPTGTTDDDGRFVIEGLVSGAPYALGVHAEGVRFDAMRLGFTADADQPVDFGLVSADR